jgi:hypothetical protein
MPRKRPSFRAVSRLFLLASFLRDDFHDGLFPRCDPVMHDDTPPPPPSEPSRPSEAELRLMTRLKRLRWKEAAGHFIVIVVGVMVALFADAWREDRNELRREMSYIADLRSDLASTLQIVDTAIARDDRFLARTEAMHAYLQSTDRVPEDSVRGWRNVEAASFVTVSGTLRALFETGDLRLMRGEVRRSLTAYAADLQNAERELDLAAVDLMAASRLIREREEAYRLYRSSRSSAEAGWYTLNVDQMRADPVLRAAYARGLVRTGFHRNRLLSFRSSVLGLRKVLDAEVAAR